MTEPLISICLEGQKKHYQPGDELACEYQIDAVEATDLQAVEASVLWYTEGKGDEDLSVHYFERRTPTDADDGDLRPLRRFRTRLPNSPLSYRGAILNVCWCVRVRAFLQRGKDVSADHHFQLGSVPVAAARSPKLSQ
jgi:hypothetical protein